MRRRRSEPNFCCPWPFPEPPATTPSTSFRMCVWEPDFSRLCSWVANRPSARAAICSGPTILALTNSHGSDGMALTKETVRSPTIRRRFARPRAGTTSSRRCAHLLSLKRPSARFPARPQKGHNRTHARPLLANLSAEAPLHPRPSTTKSGLGLIPVISREPRTFIRKRNRGLALR